ncbi:hypothetical protein GQ457_06G027420 [Hibiscus cannabinus]
MNFHQNLSCPLCGDAPKSVVHLLFTCAVSWKLWMSCATLWNLSLVFPKDLGSFLSTWHGVSISRLNDSIWHLLPFAILWSIWLFRNDIIFANSHLDAAQLFYLISHDPTLTDKPWLPKANGQSNLVWSAPPAGFLKLNVVGAMLRDGSKGDIGRILRDDFGDRLASSSLPIGSGPPILAELEAISHGLDFFFSLNVFERSRLIVECDSAIVVEWILQLTLYPDVFVSLAKKCFERIKVNSVVVRLIPRSYNVDADALVKAGIGLGILAWSCSTFNCRIVIR